MSSSDQGNVKANEGAGPAPAGGTPGASSSDAGGHAGRSVVGEAATRVMDTLASASGGASGTGASWGQAGEDLQKYTKVPDSRRFPKDKKHGAPWETDADAEKRAPNA